MIDPIQSVNVNSLVGATPAQGPELKALSERFDAMMVRDPDPQFYSGQHLGNETTAATQFVRGQEALMHRTNDEIRAFSIQAPSLGAQELAARHIDLTYQIAMVQMQFNAGVYMAQSGKTGIQTLMRNQ